VNFRYTFFNQTYKEDITRLTGKDPAISTSNRKGKQMETKKKKTTEKNPPGSSISTSSLHDAAEKKLACAPAVHPGMKGQTAEELIHELRVHQIELEMQAEELRGSQLALAESRDQYLDLYEFAPLGYLTLTDTALISQANLTAAVLLGVDRNKLINARFRKWIVPRDLETWDRYFTNLRQSEEKLTATIMLKRGDSAMFPARLESIRLAGSRDRQSIRVAISDISDIRMAEKDLQTREEDLLRAQELLEAVTKGTDVIIAAQDTDFRYTYFNQTYKEEIQHLTGKNLTIGASMVELFAEIPEDQEKSVKEWAKVLKGENVNQRIKFGDPSKDGKIYHVLHTPIRDAHGTIVGAGEVAYDVTKQIQVEDKLRETQEYLDNLITYANAPIIVWDPQFRITLFNHAFEHLTGRKAKDVLGKHFEILLPENYLTVAMDLIRKTMKGERWESVEIPILHKKGEIRTVLWNSASVFEYDGKTVVSTIAQGQDITDRKKIESKYRLRAAEYANINVALNEEIRQRNLADTTLKKTLSLLNASLESTADGIFVVDKAGKITNYNQNFVNMWNIPMVLLESAENERVMNHVLPQLKNPEEFLANIKELLSNPGRESFDMIEFNDGKIFERYSKPQKIGDSVVGRVWSFRDITDRKHAEEKLVASLQEKEVLLREIHHRVKNNLQLISGLLDMTRMRTVDESTNTILTDMMLKIQTMAQIHTRLYESKQFGKISLTGQIHDQIAGLSNIYSHKGHEISCEINSNEVFLPVDQAIPCALVVNEILSNAYKHAFKGKKQGTIEIFALQEDGKIRITVRDDGVGLPGNFDISRSTSLGLKLIRTLVQHQLKGSISFKSQNGTEISMEFPVTVVGT
jgi:PAS domain S-box-containing protein